MRFSFLKHQIKHQIRSAARLLGGLYAPSLCPVLGKEVAPWQPVSTAGLRVLRPDRLKPANRCERCFLPARGPRCTFCDGRNVYFDRHVSLFRLSSTWSRVLRRWKFENERRLHEVFLPALRRQLLRELARMPVSQGSGSVHRLGWIDSGRSGHELRAYTPCRDAALALAKDLPNVMIGPLLRKRPLRSQSSKDYTDRFLRIRDSLEFVPGSNCKKIRNCEKEPGVTYKHSENYVLIEDVFTTGATANEAARVLKAQGAGSILIISMLLREELDFF